MKRFLTILCSFLIMLTSISVLADEPTITEISESGSAEIGIGAEVPSVWKVTLPAKVTLSKQEDDTYKGIFEKVVSGDLSSDKQIRVRPASNSITIADTAGGKSNITGTLSDSNTIFLYTDLSDTGRECYITSPTLTAGTWEGTLVYNIDITKAGYQEPGFYLTDGSLLRSLTVEDVNNYGASSHDYKSLPKYLGLTTDEINTITKIVLPEMEAPKNCSYMFYYCQYVEEINVAGFDTKNVTDMSSMFSNAGQNATTFDIGDISNWNTSNVRYMSHMFYQAGQKATTFNLDLSNWNTSKVRNMYDMFGGAGSSATTWSIGDLSNWNVSNVTDMLYMFCNAGQKATTFDIGDLSNWNTENVTDMSWMFSGAGIKATTFNIGDISGWNTENVTKMEYMFYGAGRDTTYSLDLSGWNVNKVTSHDDFNRNVESKVTQPVWVN